MLTNEARFLILVAGLWLLVPASCASNGGVNGSGQGGTNASGGSGGSPATGGNNASGGSGGSAAAGGSGRGGTGGSASGGTGGTNPTGGATASAGRGGIGGSASGGVAGASSTGGSPGAGDCMDGMQNGTETGVDCGGPCPACPTYKINPPNLNNKASSGCNGGTGFMCTRSMVFSPEFKQAAADDFGPPANPAFVYGVVGHDADSGGIDQNSNTCCQCYQLVFTSPRDPVTGVPAPKPMIVQAFNTHAGGGKNFDIYMAMGGYGANSNGCPGMYSSIPTVGEPGNGGVRVENLSPCGSNNMYTEASISSASCQSAVTSTCEMLQSTKSAAVQSASQVSCIEANQPQSLYHMNWNVMAKRVECPTNLTRVTGCKLNSQNLPQADPTAVDSDSASSKGFASGFTTTTMQDCCRPPAPTRPTSRWAEPAPTRSMARSTPATRQGTRAEAEKR